MLRSGLKKRERQATKCPLVFHAITDTDAESGLYYSVCLELNIVTQGRTQKEARQGLWDAVSLYVESVLEQGDYESFWRPAPKEYWRKAFAKAKPEIQLISA